MPMFEFAPVVPKHRDWEGSTYEGRIRVHAIDEGHARECLEERYRIAVERRSVYDDTPQSPWLNPERSKLLATTDVSPSDYKEGLIFEFGGGGGVVPLATAPLGDLGGGGWVPVNERELPFRAGDAVGGRGALTSGKFQVHGTSEPVGGQAAIATKGIEINSGIFEGAGQESAFSDDTPHRAASVTAGLSPSTVSAVLDAYVVAPITQQTVVRAVQNRATLMYQAAALQDFLTNVVGLTGQPTEGRNLPSVAEALGVSEDVPEAELLELLTDLGDQLRRFNDALENRSVTPSDFDQFRTAALKAAGISFGSTLGIGGGSLIVTVIGGLLDSAGLMSWDQFIQFMKAVRG